MNQEINRKLYDIDTGSLLAEIERRKKERPKMIHNFAYGHLQEICEACLDNIDQKEDSDFKDKIYKAAMEMWFGDKVWEYINKNRQKDKL